MKFDRKKIGHYRREMGLTQAQLADRAGLTINQVKKHEVVDVNIGLHTLDTYAKFFRVDLSDLFEFSGQERIFTDLNSLKKRIAELEKESQQCKAELGESRVALKTFQDAYKILVNERGRKS